MLTSIRAATVAGLAVLAVSGSLPVPDAPPQAPPLIAWSDCGDGAQCATLTVPVDWRRPAGPTTTVNLGRVTATDPAHRVGTVVVNWGSGVSTSTLHPRMPVVDDLAASFDVVVMDMRGLGRADNNTLVPCTGPQPPVDGLVKAVDEAGWQAHAAANAAYDAGCRQAAGALFDGLTSWQAAHDLDALRAALGERKLRYIGNSYGTTFGQAYAELFPDRVERMYLDGVADHTQPWLEDWLRNYAVTQEQQLIRFRDWCRERAGCWLHDTDAAQVWDQLVARAGAHPLPAPSAGAGRTVSVQELFAGAWFGMSPPLWPRLAEAMAKARDGDAGMFLAMSPGQQPEEQGNMLGTTLCHDFMPQTPTYQQFQGIEARLKAVAPRFGWIEGRIELGRCVGIPGRPAYPPHPLTAPGLPPVLVGIGELDNNTANPGAARVARQLPGARALWHGDGHAAFVLHGNTCLNGHVLAYLVDGTLPAAGTRCPGEMIKAIPDRMPAG
ncbi:alpha/beta fold hydrolase [Pseudonocardia sp. GCM10023141]|uniref:alpha/beta fold hydrolase n=1 Tax=Pseudonocardia sp. GCM10023141 TaxID=3252653 RepID=UPI00361C8506